MKNVQRECKREYEIADVTWIYTAYITGGDIFIGVRNSTPFRGISVNVDGVD